MLPGWASATCVELGEMEVQWYFDFPCLAMRQGGILKFIARFIMRQVFLKVFVLFGN